MIVVTGGAGFIGSNIAARLAADGHDVVVVDRLGDDGVKWRNLAKTPLELILAPEELDGFLAGHRRDVEAVVHMGAISSTTARDADEVNVTNLRLSRRLWDWCAQAERPLIYASSAATYGDGDLGFEDDGGVEALARLRPLNLYGWSKAAFDLWAARAVRAGRPAPPSWAGLKFFNVYGPNEHHKADMMSLVAKNYDAIAAGQGVKLFKSHRPDYADGGQLRDFVYVKDCVEVVAWMLGQPRLAGVFNLGTGAARSFAELMTATFEAAGKPPRIAYVDMPEAIRGSYQYFTQAQMGRLRAAGYPGQFTSLEAGVRDYVGRYLAQADRHV